MEIYNIDKRNLDSAKTIITHLKSMIDNDVLGSFIRPNEKGYPTLIHISGELGKVISLIEPNKPIEHEVD